MRPRPADQAPVEPPPALSEIDQDLLGAIAAGQVRRREITWVSNSGAGAASGVSGLYVRGNRVPDAHMAAVYRLIDLSYVFTVYAESGSSFSLTGLGQEVLRRQTPG